MVLPPIIECDAETARWMQVEETTLCRTSPHPRQGWSPARFAVQVARRVGAQQSDQDFRDDAAADRAQAVAAAVVCAPAAAGR